MYAEFFKLTGLPFQLTPDSRFFFESSVHSKAMAHLTYGLNQGEGFIVITGDVGAGKTTLVEHLCSSLDPHRYTIARISTTQTSADDTLRLVAAGFGIKTEGVEKANLLQRLEATLVTAYRSGRRSLLVVDEAQNLTVPALEELRMLSNFVVGNVPPLQSFLLGQPQFRPVMALPELEQLRQRVLASYHLGPLSAEETQAYIEHRLKRVGWMDDPHFADDVFAAVYDATGGVPRKINTLCSRILLFAFLEEMHAVDRDMTVQVAEELKSELGAGAGGDATVRPAPVPMNSPLDVGLRLSRIEERIDKHDHAIKRALAIAANYIQGNVA
ncbi:MAG TPA: XrtA/PEP-CTERM system-associated ATPase [Alphaproteobacteria bacterium]|nr:XrtA/PEP-CTERM system-associated ATPase [Alphaproteobacteria bacterium]